MVEEENGKMVEEKDEKRAEEEDGKMGEEEDGKMGEEEDGKRDEEEDKENDKKRRLYLFILTYIISGIATVVAPLCGSSVIQHIVYASFFGFFSGGYVTLSFSLPSDIVKDEEVDDAIGLLCLFSGIAVAIGTPVVGAMRDVFAHFANPFLWPYFIFGTCTIFSGCILFAIPLLQKQHPRQHPKEKGSGRERRPFIV
ncbi:unnamed protein product [Adineta steineri]|uniref:Uncharacterized protein n=1 Tax=Adineta steineri TaxID=433720 RepID=A0A820AJ04_9BILA|nr:unnamed protein product [Adineta steineri]